MFDNIGGKIKSLAVAVTWIGIFASVIYGIAILKYQFLLGLAFIIMGSLASWFGSFLLYGFGHLIETAENVEYLLSQRRNPDFYKSVEKLANESKTDSPPDSEATENNTIVCPQCKFKQLANRKVCWKCGAKLDSNN